MSFSEGLLRLVNLANNFTRPGVFTYSSRAKCCPFIIAGQQVGVVPPAVVGALRHYPNVFQFLPGCSRSNEGQGETPASRLDNGSQDQKSDDHMIELNPGLKTPEQRSQTMAEVLQKLKKKDEFITLRQWRNEDFSVVGHLGEKPLLKMERAAACLFGIKKTGVHINGYTYSDEGELLMWVAKRSSTKPTWPGMWDQMAAGGVASGETVMGCARKECYQEASVPDDLLERLTPAGCISYIYEDERGVFPECQYIMDLLLPRTFEPKCNDGEVDSFQLCNLEQVKTMMTSPQFKFNCACVILDFLIRHGILTPDNEPNYHYLVQRIHMPLP